MAIRQGAAGVVRRMPVPWTGRARPQTPAARPAGDTIATVEHAGLRWINIERPGPAAIEFLRANFSFHELNLEDVLDRLQRPKLDEEDDYLYLAVQFPVHSKQTRVTSAAEVDIFIGRDYIITAHDARIKPLGRLFDEVEREPEERERFFGQGAERLLYYILDRLIDYCVPITRRISQKIEEIDEMLFEPNTQRTIEEIATVRRDIIATRRIIKPQVQIMTVLERRVRAFFRHGDEEEIEAYFGDLVDGIGKIADILDDAKEVVDSLSATTDSLTTHRLNQVIKTLTILSVIMLPLTLISSIYGMNVNLPYDEQPGAPVTFVGLLVLMALIAAVMILFFRWRRWL
ncbi:MAG: magnesium transporter CorA family protein [Chloroflexota bacterium]|nr:magnesium transporter CorA family protein [Chloroflexota bacterium]